MVSVFILLDLSAAFDSTDLDIFSLQSLKHVTGIKVTALKWFKAYLSYRFQFVHVKSCPLVPTKVNYGVPEGSVLGPILALHCVII